MNEVSIIALMSFIFVSVSLLFLVPPYAVISFIPRPLLCFRTLYSGR
jgi:hypothetical protein